VLELVPLGLGPVQQKLQPQVLLRLGPVQQKLQAQ